MSPEEKQKAIDGLSPRALKLWRQVNSSVCYFKWGSKDTPKVMDELAKAGLVETRGRIMKLDRCWVPLGTLTFMDEAFPGETQTLLREPQEPPTKPGWYYGCYRSKPENIRPIEVIETSVGLEASAMSRTFYAEPLGMFEWFGPVPVCRGVTP